MTPGRAQPFHVLLKPNGAACNLACAYCFYLPKAALYPGAASRMDDAVMERAMGAILEAHPGPEVTIAWQGGEPTLMGLAFFERAAALAERLRRPEQRIAWTLQTNGTLLDEGWMPFLKEKRFLVGLSVDGGARHHDAFRLDRAGQGTHAGVRRAARLMAEAGVDFNLLCTVHAANQGDPAEVYDALTQELGGRHLQFIPIVIKGSDGRALPPSVGPEAWGRFLLGVFERWRGRDVGRVFVQQFEVTLALHLGLPSSLCFQAPRCGTALAMERNGDVYSCDHFVDKEHRLGNVIETGLAEMLASPAQTAFGQAKAGLPPECRACPVLRLCAGGCPKDRFVPVGGGMLNWLCPGYRLFFGETQPAMARMAAEIGPRLPGAGKP